MQVRWGYTGTLITLQTRNNAKDYPRYNFNSHYFSNSDVQGFFKDRFGSLPIDLAGNRWNTKLLDKLACLQETTVQSGFNQRPLLFSKKEVWIIFCPAALLERNQKADGWCPWQQNVQVGLFVSHKRCGQRQTAGGGMHDALALNVGKNGHVKCYRITASPCHVLGTRTWKRLRSQQSKGMVLANQ